MSYSSISTKNAERKRERFTCPLTFEIMKNRLIYPADIVLKGLVLDNG